MKNILFATTALVATAGIASADVTFSGKGEAGIYRTEKVEAKAGVLTTAGTVSIHGTSGVTTITDATVADAALGGAANLASGAEIKVTKATGAATVSSNTAALKANVATAAADLAEAEAALAAGQGIANAANAAVGTADAAASTDAATLVILTSIVAAAKANLHLAELAYAAELGTKAVAAGDMIAYSGYQADVKLTAATDSGMTFAMDFDLEAGLMADKDDDREMDSKTGNIGNSKLTMTTNGYTVVVGQDAIDDLYDDSQDGDISVAGDLGGLSFTVVHDFEDSVAAKGATFTSSATTVTAATFTDAVAAVNEGTSVKLGYSTGAATLGFVATSSNDRDNSANKITVGYTVSDALSFSVKHDSQGKRDAIMSASATYAMDALTFTVSYADDKNHAGNSNKDGKASTNLKAVYSQGPVSATFATDESSQWWVNANYDLGGGASAFATIDHQEFAVAGLSFAF